MRVSNNIFFISFLKGTNLPQSIVVWNYLCFSCHLVHDTTIRHSDHVLPHTLRKPSLFDREDLDLKHQLRVGHDSPCRESPCPVPVVGSALYPRHLAQSHPYHALVPTPDYLAQTDREGERLLPRVLRRPELGREVVVLAVAGAVDGDALAGAWESAGGGGTEDGLGESHGTGTDSGR